MHPKKSPKPYYTLRNPSKSSWYGCYSFAQYITNILCYTILTLPYYIKLPSLEAFSFECEITAHQARLSARHRSVWGLSRIWWGSFFFFFFWGGGGSCRALGFWALRWFEGFLGLHRADRNHFQKHCGNVFGNMFGQKHFHKTESKPKELAAVAQIFGESICRKICGHHV